MPNTEVGAKLSNALHDWLLTLSILFISFFGVILALICIYALPGKTLPLEGSYFYLGSSVIVIGFLGLRWKKEKIRECHILKSSPDQTAVVIRETLSDKIIKWLVAIYSFLFAFCGLAIALICIYSLPDKTVQPNIGAAYFLGSIFILGSFVHVAFKNTVPKKP